MPEGPSVTASDAASFPLYSPAELAQLREGVIVLLRRELRNRALADDICNEAFRIVIERIHRQPLDDPGKLAPYLAQTARFLVAMNRRIMQRRRTVTGQQQAIEEFQDPAADPVSQSQTEDSAQALRQVLSEMPNVRDREILVRVYLWDQEKEQICRELGIDESHYKRVVYRARKRFRILIEKRYCVSDLYGLEIA